MPERRKWTLQTSAGPFEADILLTACGQLNTPATPDIPGLESFEGPAFHTAQWRHDVDLAGKRVALIGTGCSAIQAGPAIAPSVSGSPSTSARLGGPFPRRDRAYRKRERQLYERFPAVQRLDRAWAQAFQEFATAAETSQLWLLPAIRVLSKQQIKWSIKDPALRRKVTPRDQLGCKRIMVTDDWYPTLARPNVEVVTEAIESVTAGGIRVRGGAERPHDALVLATGFKSHGFVAPMEIVGAGGQTLREEWGGVPRAYLGLSVPGFPNMFLIYGPNTNGGTGSVVNTIEYGIQHVIAALQELERNRAQAIEIRREAAERSTRSSARRSRGRCGTRAAPTGTWMNRATTRISGPGCGARIAGAPRRIEPGAYALQGGPPAERPR